MTSVDISIRGAGIFGLSVAWVAVNAGARVELVDPNGVAAGASGGIVGALAPHVPENWNPKKQFQFDSLLMARAFWPEVHSAGGQDPGYVHSGRLQPIAATGLDLARARSKNAEALWDNKAEWTVTETQSDWAGLSAQNGYVFDTLSAHIHPQQACRALAAALETRGVTCVASPIATSQATLWATGAAGLDDLSRNRPRVVGQGIKGQAALLACNKRGAPQLFVDNLHIIPHNDGTVAIGSTTERNFDSAYDTDNALDDLITRVRDAVPELRSAPVQQRWAGLRPRARSRAPMLGPWPGRPGHFIANGGFKIGFGMAPKVGQVMASLILNARNDIPPDFLIDASF